MTVITTLTDADTYSREDIATLYGFRWNSELDIRSIKQSLNLAHVRCKSPEMVRRELWTTLLGYNLIRTTAAAAAVMHEKQPRHISFTSTCQYVLASWPLFSAGLVPADELESPCASAARTNCRLSKLPTAPAASNLANSNAAATATSSCNNPAPPSGHTSQIATNRPATRYEADSAIRACPLLFSAGRAKNAATTFSKPWLRDGKNLLNQP